MSRSELQKLAILARRLIEPGFIQDSTGACLHACFVVVFLLKKFGSEFGHARPMVRGGAGSHNEGALDTFGNWHGHYWVEVRVMDGSAFVIDVTADQFGHAPVVVMPLGSASNFYRAGPQPEVDEAFENLKEQLNWKDIVMA